MKFLAMGLFLAMLMMAGCEDKRDPQEKEAAPVAGGIKAPSVNVPIEVERIGMVRDKLAYEGMRGIYIIKDKRTGKEYIGVSGIGISETGRHSEGKYTKEDER